MFILGFENLLGSIYCAISLFFSSLFLTPNQNPDIYIMKKQPNLSDEILMPIWIAYIVI